MVIVLYISFNKLRTLLNCDSIMTARGALWNPSMFQKICYHYIKYLKLI